MFVSDGAMKLYNMGGTYWKYSWDITSSVFRHKYSSALFFGPTAIWNPKGEQQGFEKTTPSLPFDLFKFDAFISDMNSVQTNFPTFKTKWFNKEKSKDITSIMRYFFYYHMPRFMHDPSKLESYLSDSDYRYI